MKAQPSIDEFSSQVRELVQYGQFDEAELALQYLVEIDAVPEQIEQLRQEIAEAKSAVSEVEGAIASIRQRIVDGELKQAGQELRAAQKAHPDDPRWSQLGLEMLAARDRQRVDEVVAKLEQARSLQQEGDLDGALRRVANALEVFPSHQQALALKAELDELVEHRLKEKQGEDQRLLQVRTAALAIRQAIDEGELEKGGELLHDGVAEHGPEAEFDRLAGYLEQAYEAARRREAQKMIRQAERLLSEENFPDALERIERALALDPQDQALLELLEKAEGGHAEQIETLRREQQIEKVFSEVSAELDQEHVEAAEAVLAEARESLGADPRFEALRVRMTGLRVEQIDRDLARCLQDAKAKTANGDYEGALESLREALATDPGSGQARELLAQTEADYEAHRQSVEVQQTELVAAADEIRRSLEERDADLADELLIEAERHYPQSEDLEQLRQQHHGLVTTLRQETVGQALSAAQKQLDDGQLEAAQEVLREGLQQVPEQDELQSLLDDVLAQIEEHKRQERETQLQEATLSVAALIDSGKLSEAESELQSAVLRFGSSAPLEELKKQLQQLRVTEASLANTARGILAASGAQAETQRAEVMGYTSWRKFLGVGLLVLVPALLWFLLRALHGESAVPRSESTGAQSERSARSLQLPSAPKAAFREANVRTALLVPEIEPPPDDEELASRSADQRARRDQKARDLALAEAAAAAAVAQEVVPEPVVIERPVPVETLVDARVVSQKEATAPKFARRGKVVVTVRVLVDEAGQPTQVEAVTEPAGRTRYRKVAEAAARESIFSAGSRNEVPEPMWVVLTYTFDK